MKKTAVSAVFFVQNLAYQALPAPPMPLGRRPSTASPLLASFAIRHQISNHRWIRQGGDIAQVVKILLGYLP